jgi:transcriptional regulator with XRE-family HTH domain
MMTTLKNPQGVAKLRLGALLKERGLGICEFADMCGLEYHAVGKLVKNGWARIGFDTLYLLAVALGVQVGDLFEEITVED